MENQEPPGLAIMDLAGLSKLDVSPACLLYIWVDWSEHELLSRQELQLALPELQKMPVELYSLADAHEYAWDWRRSKNWRPSAGNGHLVWLRCGETFRDETNARFLGADGIVKATAELLSSLPNHTR